jgi:hypothetical protein
VSDIKVLSSRKRLDILLFNNLEISDVLSG